WRARIGGRKASDIDLAALPILTREGLRTQVTSEGPLLREADGLAIDVMRPRDRRDSRATSFFPMSMSDTTRSGASLNTSWKGGIYRSIERESEMPMVPWKMRFPFCKGNPGSDHWLRSSSQVKIGILSTIR